MLIFSEERLIPTDVNMMTIAGKAGGYYYIHRALYDQAVVLYDSYVDEKDMLIRAITGNTESREDVDRFFAEVPPPINILGAFLLLVKTPLEELVDMIGAIHVMSGPINLRKMIQIPFEMRNSIPSFSLSIREEYQLAWDRFLRTTMPYSEEIFLPRQQVVYADAVNPVSGVTTTTHTAYDFSALGKEDATVDDMPELSDDAVEAFWDNFDLSSFDDDDEEEGTGEAPNEAVPAPTIVAEEESAPTVEPEPEPEPEPVKKPEKKELSFVDQLLAGDL